MPKFRKKPVVIDAEQFFPDKDPWPDGVFVELGVGTDPNNRRYLVGFYPVSPGDWIITGESEKYPCRPDIFEMTYEPAPEEK